MDSERKALRASIIGSLAFGVLGLSFSLLTGSGAILLDGFFSLINFVLALVTLRVAGLVTQPADERFQFGYASFEPLINTVKGLVILLVCGFALFSAVSTLIDGGRSMEMGWGVLYALVATAGCFAVAAYQKRASRQTDSPLVAVEVHTWMIDGLMSAAVALAFGASYLAEGSRFDPLLPFVDPTVVILLVLFALPIPLGIVRSNLGELLLGAPPEEAGEALTTKIQSVMGELPVERTVIRMMKVGRQRAALVYVLVAPGTALDGIEELDVVRKKISDELASLEPTWVVDVLFVSDERWIS